VCVCVCVCVCVSYLIDVLVSFDEVNREFPQWGAGRVSETGGDPPLEYGHIRQHLQGAATRHHTLAQVEGSVPQSQLQDIAKTFMKTLGVNFKLASLSSHLHHQGGLYVHMTWTDYHMCKNQ